MNLKLKKEPFLESIWEIRFEGINSSEVIAGLLYEFLRDKYESLNITKLPASFIPLEISNIDNNLLFTPKILIEIKNTSLSLQIGEKILTLNCKKPYIGWSNFSFEIIRIFNFINNEKKLINFLNKFSLRYINFLNKEEISDLSGLNLSIKFADWDIIKENLLLKIEKEIENYKYVIHVLNSIFINELNKDGIIVDIELELKDKDNCFENINKTLDNMHENIKYLFFGKILKDDILKKLQ